MRTPPSTLLTAIDVASSSVGSVEARCVVCTGGAWVHVQLRACVFVFVERASGVRAYVRVGVRECECVCLL
jgi:hypothetical protein